MDGEELDVQQWYRRIGHFMPLSWDEWWRLPAGADPAPIGDDVLQVVRDHGLPAMLAHMAGDDRR